MKDLNAILNLTYWNNTVRDYAYALILLLVFWIALFLFKKIVLNAFKSVAKRTKSDIDEFIANQIDRFGILSYLTVTIFLASRSLNLSTTIDAWILYSMIAVVTFQLVLMIQATIGFAFERAMHVAGEDARVEMSSLKTFSWLLNGLIWLIALLFILSNFGINITSVIAGLGIGGVAIALAAQSILGDFFASITILLDKPFRVGDTLNIAPDINGVVEHIGIKTSRLRSITGEQIILSNSDLTSSRIRNMQRMLQRRVLYRFGVRYETPAELARAVPDLLEEIISGHEMARFDRAHFAALGDFALVYEVVYFVRSADQNLFMDLQQSINFQILNAFQERGIKFAYPTQNINILQTEILPKT